MKDYLEQSITEEDPESAVERLEGSLTKEQIVALEEKERVLFGRRRRRPPRAGASKRRGGAGKLSAASSWLRPPFRGASDAAA